MNSSNPALRDSTFRGFAAVGERRMTINGTIGKTLVLLVLLAFTFTITWSNVMEGDVATGMGLAMLGGIVGLVLSIVLAFKQAWAPVLAPVFAVFEGLLLGGVSASYELSYGTQAGMGGIATQALFGTVCVFLTMLLTYRTGLVKVTDRFRAVISIAMLSIFVIYLLSFLLSFAGISIPLIHSSGPIGIGFSIVVIVVASLMLLVDFDLIERGVRSGAPRYMEWYAGFALLVTLIWIYLEMLRLLAKLRSR